MSDIKFKEKINKKTILKIIIVILILLLLFFGIKIARKYILAAKTQKQLDELIKTVQDNNQNENKDDPQYTENPKEEKKESSKQNLVYSKPDMEKVCSLNPDIIGWISIDGTRINYPILYSTDNSFYLSHNYLKEYDSQGSIYIETVNNPDFSDFNTVIYGHSMLNGNMFRALHDFANSGFFNSHKTIMIYTKTATLKYKIFECARISNNHIFTYLDLTDPDSVQTYADNLNAPLSGALYDPSVLVLPSDNIITLSTCTMNDNVRITLYAKLVEVY